MSVNRNNIIFLLLAAMFMSCNERVSQEQLIETALALKVAQWQEQQIKLCTDKAQADAEAYVDSILIIYSLPSKLDTISKPPKPNKPPKPVFKTKPDSVIVKELEKEN
jgi:hypothetical protein